MNQRRSQWGNFFHTCLTAPRRYFHFLPLFRISSHETDIQTTSLETSPQNWVPGPNGYPRRTSRDQRQATQRTQTSGQRLGNLNKIIGESVMSPNQTLPGSSRLKRNRDFVRVRRKGKPFRCHYFTLFSSPNAKSLPARIGISASRRVGSAVTRNRAKRHYRELFRKIHHQIHPGSDLLLSIRKPSANASFQELEHRFLQAIRYLRLLRSKP